jgi:hypothetical protein
MWLFDSFTRSKVSKTGASNNEDAQSEPEAPSQLDRFLHSEAPLHLTLSFVGGGAFLFVAPVCKKIAAMYKTIEYNHPPSLPRNDEFQLVEAKEPVAAAPVDKQLVKLCTCSTSFCTVFQSVQLLETACSHGFPLTAFHGGFGLVCMQLKICLSMRYSTVYHGLKSILVLQLLVKCRQCAI